MLVNVQEDKVKSSQIRLFYNNLGFDRQTKVYVIKDSTFNAFALPDNSIFVHDGALNHIDTYQQLSALLAHEYAHIKKRHGMKALAHMASWDLLGKVLTGGDQKEPLINSANTLLSLKSSRSFENEADMEAFNLLIARRIHPSALSELMEKMLQLYPDENSSVPPYLSSHPSTKSRLVRINKELTKKNISSVEDKNLNELFRELKN